MYGQDVTDSSELSEEDKEMLDDSEGEREDGWLNFNNLIFIFCKFIYKMDTIRCFILFHSNIQNRLNLNIYDINRYSVNSKDIIYPIRGEFQKISKNLLINWKL